MYRKSLLDSEGEGEGGMIWENGIETCIIPYMKQITSPGSMMDTGCLGLVHWDDKEGLYGQGGGRGVQTPSSNNTREDSTHGHHQMVNTEIRLIMFFAGKMEKLYTVNKNKTRS